MNINKLSLKIFTAIFDGDIKEFLLLCDEHNIDDMFKLSPVPPIQDQ